VPVRVVDASAAGALVFSEPGADRVVADLAGASLVAPALLGFELASICLKKVRAHPRKAAQILAAFRLAHRLAIEFVDVAHEEVVTLARETGLTTYDASYLWLARHLGADLVTLDERVRRAAAALAPRQTP
jgi:predicted nucleic acid-binding protein